MFRVARGPAADALSSTNNVALIANITTTPAISNLSLDSNNNFRRDEAGDHFWHGIEHRWSNRTHQF